VRARSAAAEDYRRKRQQVSSFLLRHGRSFAGSTTWKGQHLRWLNAQNFTHPAQRLAYQESLNAAFTAAERVIHLEAMLEEIIPAWTWRQLSRHSRRCVALPSRQPQPWLPRRETCAALTIPGN